MLPFSFLILGTRILIPLVLITLCAGGQMFLGLMDLNMLRSPWPSVSQDQHRVSIINIHSPSSHFNAIDHFWGATCHIQRSWLIFVCSLYSETCDLGSGDLPVLQLEKERGRLCLAAAHWLRLLCWRPLILTSCAILSLAPGALTTEEPP